MRAEEAISVSNNYTNQTVIGMGAIKGAPCTIKSMTKVGKLTTTVFEWTDLNGDKHENTMLVYDGTDGTNGTNGQDGAPGADGFSPTIVVKTSTSTEYILTITDKNGSYDTPNLKGSGGGGGASTMSDLTDVDLTNLANGSALIYDSEAAKWEATDLTLSNITDIDLTGIQDRQVLVCDAEHSKLVPADQTGTQYSAGEGINIDQNNAISSKFVLYTGAKETYEAMPLSERVKYTHTAFNNDSQVGLVDAVPTENSPNLVTSGGTYSELAKKADASALAGKADVATSLAGYGIADAYTKTETDGAITTKIEKLDVTDSVVTGSYVTGVSETDGKISVTREAADDAPTASSNKMVKSGGVFNAIKNSCRIHVYGAEWDGSSSHAWTRTDDAASFSDPQPYYAGMSETPSSPFDDCAPWSDMKIVEDADLGTLVRIPRFWYKWTRTGTKMKLQIADAPLSGFFVSPAHADRGDGSGERPFVYVGRYHCAASTYKSTSGVLPQVSTTRADFRTAISNLHAKAWQYDFAMWWTINMLYLVEFADWNSQAKIGGGCSETTATSSAVYNMGSTDSMPYHTGTISNSLGATVYGANQYRHIENLWGNCLDWIDGIYFADRDVYCIKNPANFSDTTGGTNVGTRANANGVVAQWTDPSASGFEYALYPAAVTTDSQYETYDCDNSYYNASGVVLRGGGYCGQSQGNGAFYLSGGNNASYQSAYIGSRLQKLP